MKKKRKRKNKIAKREEEKINIENEKKRKEKNLNTMESCPFINAIPKICFIFLKIFGTKFGFNVGSTPGPD